MFQIAMNSKGGIDCNTLLSINDSKKQGAINAQNIESVNRSSGNANTAPYIRPNAQFPGSRNSAPAAGTSALTTQIPAVHASAPATGASAAATPVSGSQASAPATGIPAAARAPGSQASAPATSIPTAARVPISQAAPVAGTSLPGMQAPNLLPAQKTIPPLVNLVRKGQKTSLAPSSPLNAIHACFGWNAANTQCDVDVSAFLLKENGKVLGDSWFVFYGQPFSPGQSVTFHAEDKTDRERISIRFQGLNPEVKKIVFALTINDALEKHLHFGMIRDAYIRILDAENNTELVSFQMTDYYSNVISMIIGEVYLHNGTWKFNAVGNGVAKDLSGLCTLYGVEVAE